MATTKEFLVDMFRTFQVWNKLRRARKYHRRAEEFFLEHGLEPPLPSFEEWQRSQSEN